MIDSINVYTFNSFYLLLIFISLDIVSFINKAKEKHKRHNDSTATILPLNILPHYKHYTVQHKN